MRLVIPLITLALAAVNPLLARSQEKLKIISRPVITPDLFCNPEGQATGDLILRNDGSAAVPIHLSAGDLSSKSPAKHLLIHPELTPKDGSLKDAGLNPKQELTVQATITKLYDDGDWESTIQNEGVDVGTLRVVRNTPPFSLGLDVATPDTPELTFVKGKPAYFRLKNTDPREYQLAWEYSVNGRIVHSGDSGTQPTVTIPAGGQQEIGFSPPPEWFGGWFTGLFKDKDVPDARLTVSLVDPKLKCTGHSPVSRTFKVKTHLATSSGASREGWVNIWVFVFLALGGMFSLGLNSWLPNQMRRLKIKEQLSKLGAQISNLSYDLASRLRVLAGMEVRLIKDRLRNLTWTSTDFSGEIQSIDQAMDRLGTRLKLLEQLGATRTNFTKLRFDVLPPSMIFAMEQKFEKIVEIGQKADLTAEGVQMAQKLVKEIQDQLDLGVQGNDDFAKSLAAQVTKFKAEFDPRSGRIGKTDTCKGIRGSFPGPFDRLYSTDEKAINGLSAQDYINLDGRLFELALIRDYVDFVEGMALTDDWRKKITAHEGELLRYLRLCSCEAMYAARLLFRQMKDGFFKDDLQTEIEAKRVRIKVDRGAIRQYAPSEFRLEFLKLALNNANARQEWTCRWAFTLCDQTPDEQKSDDKRLIEEGWAVTHYFQEHTKYKVKITLTHNMDGTAIQVPDVEFFPLGEIDVLPEERRRFGQAVKAVLQGRWPDAKKAWKNRRHTGKGLDHLRLALALVVALFALMAGAKEQLLKLDVLPALLAIFMVGFGADQIKNLLTQKPPADTNMHR